MATLIELQRQLERARQEFARLQELNARLTQQYVQAGSPTAGPIYDAVAANDLALGKAAVLIDTLTQQIQQLNPGGTSSGNIVQQDDQAVAENARTQAPNSPPLELDKNGRIRPLPSTTSGTNALPSPTPDAQDFGTDAELRPLIITQGTPGTISASPTAIPAPNDAQTPPTPGGSPGVGSPVDDSGTVTANSTQREIDIQFNEQKIVPQSNVLDQYASYTYTASIYLMTADAVGLMMRTKKKSLDGTLLLMQSGGAPTGSRNQFFTNDYYIDSIKLSTVIQGKGTHAAHNVQTMEMVITEPNGITLLDNLDRAIAQYLGNDNKKKNFGACNYLLVIRFYGYDINGNLVRGGVPKLDGSTDESAFIEKFYPFSLRDLTFSVGSKTVEYHISAVVQQYQTSVGTSRGTIPYNLELGGRSIRDLLTAAANPGDQTGAPQNLNAAPSKSLSVRPGLFTIMNQIQQNLVPGLYEIADQYEIEFVGDAIPNAKLVLGGPAALITDYACVGIPDSPDQQLLGNLSVDPTSRLNSIVAGTQIVQAIEAIVRNSTYIQDQSLLMYNDKTRKWVPNLGRARNVAWYKISFEAYPLGWDNKRNDQAYLMKYIVSPYRISGAPPPYFTQPVFKGVHKVYNYWFTGQNTQVLDYTQRFNNQYTQVLSGSILPFLTQQTQNLNTLQKYNFSPYSNESNQQANEKVNEPAANLADYLYNPADLSTVDLTIVGDPAWLQQGEAFAGRTPDNWNFGPFDPDGSINYDSQEILFEVVFNTPDDYDLKTGLADPGKNNFASNRSAGEAGRAKQSYIFRATTVDNMFEKGKFIQRLHGVGQQYNTPVDTDLNRQAQELREAYGQTRTGNGSTPLVPGTTMTNPPNPPVISKAGNEFNQILRVSAARAYSQPQAPTSSGQPVGPVNTPSIDPTTGQPISSNERIIGQGASPDNNTQIGAASDDAGIDAGQQEQNDLNLRFGGTVET